jgi:hypothetical protein
MPSLPLFNDPWVCSEDALSVLVLTTGETNEQVLGFANFYLTNMV